MKKVLFIIAIFIATGISAQSKYQNGMQKAFGFFKNGEMTKASQQFERISKAEPKNWLPAYYAARVEILSAFRIKDEAKLTTTLNKAQDFLSIAKANSENNPEIIITQALLNTAYIAFDGQKYGMTLSGKNTQLYAKALEIAPKNPRIVLANAEWNMGSARYFGKSTKPYCEQIQKAIELGKKEKIEEEFYPKFQVKRAEQVLQKCQN
jgi:hypothetical protein